ncbi:MAG: pseudouridine synthase [Anaerolineae bacterium]|nr:pseudouridine synthase [Anaerolineae bacterium]
MGERLQKLLAHAGYGSRRACEELIREGRVTVNGQVAQLGQKVDPQRDRVAVDGKLVRFDQTYTYVIVYKPRGVLSDERSNGSQNVTTVRELVPVPGHLYPVGRLDLRSEGLVLLTDDGELANLLTHPRYRHTKEYRVCVVGRPTEEALDRWRKGVFLDGRRTAPAEVSVLHREPDQTWLRVVLHEGRKRQIRRIAAMLGYPVKRLIRVRIGPIQLGKLKPGEWRPLRAGEIAQLLEIKKQLRSQDERKKHCLHRD